MSMKAIKDFSMRAIDDLFRSATNAAKEEAEKHGLPLVGINQDGELVKHPDREPQRSRNVA